MIANFIVATAILSIVVDVCMRKYSHPYFCLFLLHWILSHPLASKEADGLAVRMSLAETHIVAENLDFLRRQGVDLDVFDTRVGTILG